MNFQFETTVDLLRIRQQSWILAEKFGVASNLSLPLLEEPTEVRSKTEVADRIFVLHALAAAAYGMEREEAHAWLEQERVTHALTGDERRFLDGAEIDPMVFKAQIECLWALCWAVGTVSELKFDEPCGNYLIQLLPRLTSKESGQSYRDSVMLRALTEIVQMADLAYCLHWGVVEAKRQGYALLLNYGGLMMRRHALDWLISEEPWDDQPSTN